MSETPRIGPMRRSTLALVVAFVLVLAVYLYSRPDPTTNQNSPVYVPPTTSLAPSATTTTPAGIPFPGIPGLTIPVPTPTPGP